MNENNDNNNRIIFRPTDEQYNRLIKQMNKGQFKHMSELIRYCIERGLRDLEGGRF